MPTYKLYYFNGRGRAEQIRLVFTQAGVPYEDIRLTGEKWEEFKPKTPYGFMPVLEVDGKMLAGSLPIVRYVAEQHGLAGSNAFENADIASITDILNDLEEKLFQFFFQKDEAWRAELKKTLVETHFPRYLGALEKRAAGNNSADGWIIGQRFTYADISIYLMCTYVDFRGGENVDEYPNLKKIKESVEKLPAIAKWLKERPETDF